MKFVFVSRLQIEDMKNDDYIVCVSRSKTGISNFKSDWQFVEAYAITTLYVGHMYVGIHDKYN